MTPLPLGMQEYIRNKQKQPGFWGGLWRDIKKFPQKAWNTAADTAQLSFHKPFPQTYQNIFKGKKSPERLNIFFTGAAESGGKRFNDMLKDNDVPYQMFRHVDYDKAQKLISQLRKLFPKLKINVYGHSMGSRAAAKLAQKYPFVKGFLFDPVYPLGASYPKNTNKNLYTFYPQNTSVFQANPMHAWNNLVAAVGGRRDAEDLGSQIVNEYQPWDHANIQPSLRFLLNNQKQGKGLGS